MTPVVIILLVLLVVALTWVLFRDAGSVDEARNSSAQEKKDEPPAGG